MQVSLCTLKLVKVQQRRNIVIYRRYYQFAHANNGIMASLLRVKIFMQVGDEKLTLKK